MSAIRTLNLTKSFRVRRKDPGGRGRLGRLLRPKAIRTAEALWNALGDLCDSVSPDENAISNHMTFRPKEGGATVV